jgi:hypothetical protein
VAEPDWIIRITALDPEEPREIIHVVDGTQVRAQILEADSQHFQAQVVEPFQASFGRRLPLFVIGITGLCFVREGRSTTYLHESLTSGIVNAYNEWRRRNHDKEFLMANRDTLEPVINGAYLEVHTICGELESNMARMRSLGDALEVEFRHERSALRLRFKRRECGQQAYQAAVKKLQENGPTTDSSMRILAEAQPLYRRINTLKDSLQKSKDDFYHLHGIHLQEAIEFLGLKPLPIDLSHWTYEPQRLTSLIGAVHQSLLRRQTWVICAGAYDEPLVQVGDPDFARKNLIECQVFIKQLVREFGEPPTNAGLTINSERHEFGRFKIVAVWFDPDDPEAKAYGDLVEDGVARWDTLSLQELADLGR